MKTTTLCFFLTLSMIASTLALAADHRMGINEKAMLKLSDQEWEVVENKSVFQSRVALFRWKKDPASSATRVFNNLQNPEKLSPEVFFKSKACSVSKESVEKNLKITVTQTQETSPLGFPYCVLNYTVGERSETQLIFPARLNVTHPGPVSAAVFTIQSKKKESTDAFVKQLLAQMTTRPQRKPKQK